MLVHGIRHLPITVNAILDAAKVIKVADDYSMDVQIYTLDHEDSLICLSSGEPGTEERVMYLLGNLVYAEDEDYE